MCTQILHVRRQSESKVANKILDKRKTTGDMVYMVRAAPVRQWERREPSKLERASKKEQISKSRERYAKIGERRIR